MPLYEQRNKNSRFKLFSLKWKTFSKNDVMFSSVITYNLNYKLYYVHKKKEHSNVKLVPQLYF